MRASYRWRRACGQGVVAAARGAAREGRLSRAELTHFLRGYMAAYEVLSSLVIEIIHSDPALFERSVGERLDDAIVASSEALAEPDRAARSSGPGA